MSAPPATAAAAPPARAGASLAALVAVPYLVLMLVWAMSNPPGASPDESDHLVKSLGAATLDVGQTYTGPPAEQSLVAERNASLARVFEIPARLSPVGLDCTKFQPDQTAACQPPRSDDGGTVTAVAAVGAYPVFLYVPLGWAASLGGDAVEAVKAGRVLSAVVGALFIGLATWHLTRWLGPRRLLGLPVVLTPMVLFVGGSLSTSGWEITAATAVAAVVVVATRRPASLADGPTLALLTVAGCVLVLSRQTGAVVLALLGLVALGRGAWPVLWGQLRRGAPRLLVPLAAVVVSGVAVVVWELRYDHPAHTGSAFAPGALRGLANLVPDLLRGSIGLFGYLDTALPLPALAAWIAVVGLVVGLGLAVGSRADVLTVVAVLAVVVVFAYVTYATVFFPIQAGLQGRHLLAMVAVVPLLAGVAASEWLDEHGGTHAVARLTVVVGAVVALVHVWSLAINARRYAVGSTGPWFFVDDAQWAPAYGWVTWLGLGLVGAVLLAVVLARAPALGPRPVDSRPVDSRSSDSPSARDRAAADAEKGTS
ncbi:DUF2142 domain-containing protein [Angustibacter speluncae]